MTDTDMLYMSSQAKRITDLENENRELKRVLKMAVEDFRVLIEGTDTCEYCKWFDTETTECNFPDKDTSCKDIVGWKHEGESLKLIGGNDNG